MIWKVVYLVVFSGGLVLAVHSMLHGVERWRRRDSGRPSALLNPPTVAALAMAFGACGYLLVTRSEIRPLFILAMAGVCGAAALTGMTVFMAKWALRVPDHPVVAEEDEINGQVALVSQDIKPGRPGEIRYVAWGREHILSAQSIDGTQIAAGTEVVIDVLENGVARVELWSAVEQRL